MSSEGDAVFLGVVNGDVIDIQSLVQQALAEGQSAERILNYSLTPAMAEVGSRFERGEGFIPEMMASAEAMRRAMELLNPLLTQTNKAGTKGKAAVGTVQGDIHDIGKNLIITMLRGAGFEVDDLGVDVKPEDFVNAAVNGAQIIGMSALLTTTMPSIDMSLAALRETGLRSSVRIMVGGAPVTPEYAERIGADGFAWNAASAVRLAERLIAELG